MPKRKWMLRIWRDEGGTSLVELVVLVAMLGGLLAIVQQTLFSTSQVIESELGRSQTVDELRTALGQLERQVRSGNLFYDPALEASAPEHGIAPGMSLRVYTQVNVPANQGHPNRCMQWRIHEGELQTREWSPSWETDDYVTGFQAVAKGIVNVERGVQAFTLDQSQGQYARRLLKVVLLTNVDERTGSDARVEVSLTGRNTGYGFPITSCDAIPPY